MIRRDGDDGMARRVLLVMKKRMLSDALIAQTSNDTRFTFTTEPRYASAALTAEACSPEIAVVEIPESGSWKSAEKCFAVCDMIRRQLPDCKLVIICSEDDNNSCQAAIQAKQEHRIDDFLFYDNSAHYLLSKLEALV